MKNNKINIKTVIIVILIGIISYLIMMNLNNKNNSIEQQLIKKEQLGETTQDNAYIELRKHTLEVQEEEQKLLSFKSAISSAITEMGIETSENADETTMANNIKNISSNNQNEEYLIGTPYTYKVDGGITATVYSNQQIKMVRSSQSACGITISGVDLSEYSLVRVQYRSLTSMSLNLYAGDLSVSSKTQSGTIELDVTEIKTTANVKVALGGADGQVYIESLRLIP